MGKELSSFSLDIFSLKGKTAMITGANQGLGVCYALALAKAGADVFIPHFTEEIDCVKAAVEATGRRVGFLRGDLTDPNYRQRCVDTCLSDFGRIDILINNAGNNHNAPLLEFTDKKWDMVIALQMDVVQYMSHLVAAHMAKQGGGKIINIASALSFASDIGSTAYTVAKHGIVGMTRSYAAELGCYNITCNAIAPGFFHSPMSAELMKNLPELYEKVCARIPLSKGGWGDIFDLMGTAVFLSSPASDYLTGIVLSVDGGFKAQMI